MIRPLIVAVASLTLTQAPGDPRPTFIEPSLSPDRSEIAFSSGGDIWTVPARGGDARLLISHPATDSRPLYSPDGTRLAFWSNRTGNGDIYVLTLASGTLQRITFDDVNDVLDAWSRDGRQIYFSSSSREIAGMNDTWRVNASGGTPMQVAADRYASEYWSAPSPDGRSVAITARGTTAGQWWRNGRSHLDESEIWVVTPGTGAPAYRRVSDGSVSASTTRGAKELWPMWAGDGATIHYVSDRSGAENVWKRPASGGPATQVTKFARGRLLWPQASYDGRTIVFERDFGIWTLDVATGEAKPVSIALRGVAAGPAAEHLTMTTAGGLAVSPDARKLAFTMHGEVFAASARDGGAAARVTNTTGLETQVSWAGDSRRIAYTSDRDGAWHLFTFDFVANQERRLTNTPASDVTPVWSPDGKSLLFSRDARELRILDVAAGTDRLLATGRFDYPPLLSDSPFRFSPDNRWVAFLTADDRGFTNAFLVPAAGGTVRQVSFGSNSNGDCLQWSPDGKFLILCSSQRTEATQLVRVDLVPRAPRFREDLFRELFPGEQRPARPDSAGPPAAPGTVPAPNAPPRDTAAARRSAPPAVEPVFDNIRRRSSAFPLNVDVGAAIISPDGKTLVVSANAAGQQQLWAWSLDEDAAAPPSLRQITTSTGGKQRIQFSPDSREVWFLEGGRVSAVNVETRAVRNVAVSGEMDVDFAREKMEVLQQAHSYLRDNFFDAKMNGADWPALGETFKRQIAGARTPDEMRRLLSLMIGELNASHLGATGGTPVAPYTGKLGARFDRAEYEANGRLKITEIIPLGPLTLVSGIAVGDYILAVDGTAISANTNLDELLSYKTGKRVVLGVASVPGGPRRDVPVRPISTAAEKNLVYRAWVEERRAYVARVSDGQLGYVHMLDMSDASLNQLHLDLDTENHSRKGVVVDVRNNNGGFVNPYALDVFARRGYLTFQGRNEAEMPGRLQVGQRSLERPTVLVTNQHSLSDAEDFTEGYRALKLGKVVGEPTAGWIVFTWNVGLIDGTTLRLPRQRIRGADGKDMELVPRPVDVVVTRPIGESYTGRDSQLDEAVRTLLGQIR